MIRKFLKFIWVIQEKDSEMIVTRKKDFTKHLYKRKYRRVNPFNPLTYLVILITIVVGVFMFGLVGFKKEIGSNPFKWQ